VTRDTAGEFVDSPEVPMTRDIREISPVVCVTPVTSKHACHKNFIANENFLTLCVVLLLVLQRDKMLGVKNRGWMMNWMKKWDEKYGK